MNLTTKQRIDIIKKLADTITNMEESNGFLFLEEYIKDFSKYIINEHGEEYLSISFNYDGILNCIQRRSDDATIFKMYKDLFPEEAKKEFADKKLPYRLSTDKLVLFFSHSYKNVKVVTSVKNILEKTDWIECFVAHKDIKIF